MTIHQIKQELKKSNLVFSRSESGYFMLLPMETLNKYRRAVNAGDYSRMEDIESTYYAGELVR